MQFRHFTNPYFCDILKSREIMPGKQKYERGNQNEKRTF